MTLNKQLSPSKMQASNALKNPLPLFMSGGRTGIKNGVIDCYFSLQPPPSSERPALNCFLNPLMATPSTLTSDIQRSIQQAVNNAHVALNNPGGAVKVNRKKRKRGGEDAHDRSTSADSEGAGRKKSKKKKSPPRDGSAAIPQDTAIGGSFAPSEPPQPAEKPAKKKKKKGKGRETEIPIDPALTANSEGSPDPQTIALIQALVAAADTTNPQLTLTQDHQLVHPPFDPNAQMMFTGHFMPMVPSFPYHMQHGFVDPAGLVNGTPGRPSLPELASHANEEIMRTLQGVDLAKLQGMLQVLGDAAAVAEHPTDMLHLPLGFQGMPPPPVLPPTKQNPAQSHMILGQPSKSNNPPPPPDWQQFANPVHAELLATKWMNTTKLKEMSQAEGLLRSRVRLYNGTELNPRAHLQAREVFRDRRIPTTQRYRELQNGGWIVVRYT